MNNNKWIQPSIKTAFLMGAFAMSAAHASTDRDWTGFYLGINAGGNWGEADIRTLATNDAYLNVFQSSVNAHGKGNLDPEGFTAGVEGGYNWQFSESWVLGMELEFDSLYTNETRHFMAPYDPTSDVSAIYTQTQNLRTEWVFMLRPRLGYAVDDLLVYITGGLTLAQLKIDNSFFDGAFYSQGDKSETEVGWAVGAGLEYLLEGDFQNFSVKLEYLFADLGDISTSSDFGTQQGVGVIPQIFDYTADFHTNIIRLGANYYF
jgi:outer membrane immunogenic protein